MLTTTQAGLRTLHEAGPELQRTISTDLEVTSKEIFLLTRQYFKDDVQQMFQSDVQQFFKERSKVMMAAEAMAGADAEEDIHTRF